MKKIILHLGKMLHPVSIVALVIGLNVYWLAVLEAFGAYFERIAGAPLLDLENVSAILPAAEAQQLIAAYGDEARTLYWQFFVMDSLAPPLVFASFALLWVALLQRSNHAWATRFLHSPLLFLPLGVGFFDWWENLAFVTAIMADAGSGVYQLLQIGLAFVWLKAICLFATFFITAVLLLYRGVTAVANRLSGSKYSPV